MSHFAKRHYEAIALVLQDTQPPKENAGLLGYDDQVSQWENCRDALADMFRRDNQRFQYDRFIAACECGVNVKLRTRYAVVA